MISLHPDVLTFDCYGTLIDWERGLLAALQPLLHVHNVERSDADVLERFAALESTAEAGPYRTYRSVLGLVLDGLGEHCGFTPTAEERHHFSSSVPSWPPFPDTAAGLRALSTRFKLAVITNCDNDLFAGTAGHFPITFDEVVTAEHVGSYKPSAKNFEVAFERLAVPRDRILHVAQSLYHDIAPARELGLTTVWVNRRGGDSGSGATPPANAIPDHEVSDLRGLVELLGLL
ncbi:MAG: haloacid dehalogenase type II [Chloroflexota bacterium]